MFDRLSPSRYFVDKSCDSLKRETLFVSIFINDDQINVNRIAESLVSLEFENFSLSSRGGSRIQSVRG